WRALYFGRGTLGPLASLLPLQETLLFHRFIGGVHIAAIMLIGVGGSAVFALLRAQESRTRTALAAAAIAILLVPAIKERLDFENLNALWMRQTKSAIDADTDMASLIGALRELPAGRVYAAPSSGHGEYVALADREQVSSATKLFPHNRAFVNGAGPTSRTYIRWDYPAAGDRVVSGEVSGCASGTLRYERIQANRFDFIASCPNAATFVVKETYHPNWRATVDGQAVETFMVSPSFIGIALPAGAPFVTVEYR